MGRDGNDWGGNAHCLRECDEFVDGQGGSAATGIGSAHRTWCRLDANRDRTSYRKRDAWLNWRIAGRWLSLCWRALPRRDRSLEPTSLERNRNRCANAGIHVYSFAAVGSVVWIDSGAEIRAARHWLGSAKRGADHRCEPGTPWRAEFAGGRPGGHGAGAFNLRWLDDSHFRGIAESRSGIC